jgi:hypothetical protein
MLIAVYLRKPTPMLIDGTVPADAAKQSLAMHTSYRVSIVMQSRYISKPIAFKYY